jgi:O-antigen/teichoic acid export membrane protein
VLIVPVILIAAALAGYSQSFVYLLAFSTIAIVGNSLVLLAGSVFRAHEQMVSLSLMNSLVLISSAVIGILWIHLGAGIQELIFLLVATPTINSLVLFFYVRRHYARFSLSEGLMAWKSLFRKAVPLAIFNLLAIIVMRFDILLLSMTAGMNDTGIYAAARNITDTLTLFIQGFIGAVFPFIAIKWKESAMTAVKNYEHTLRFLTIFGMAAAVGIYMLSDKIIVLLYSAKYLESAVCLKILIWSFMLTALGGPVSMILIITEDRLKHYIPYALSVTAMSVILNIWLTPQYGYYSASYIAVLSSVCAFVLRLKALGNLLPVRPQWFSISWRPISASIIMGLSIRQIGDLPLSVLIPFGFVTYIISLVALGEFANDYRMFKRRLRTPVQ